MTDTTATQGLLRTTASDNPRQMATYLQTLAEQVDRRMATQAYNQRRSRRPPFACLQLLTEIVYDSNASPNEIQFDTVGEDTAGLADLSVDPAVINLTTAGWWMVGGYAHTTGFGAANSDTQLNIGIGSGSFAEGSVRDGAIALAATGTSTLVRMATPGVGQVRMDITWNGSSVASTTILRYAEMWAFRVRDL